MLELGPTCEHCSKKSLPQSTEAMICTFCSDCVRNILGDVCPNCGGEFCPRPIRPARNYKGGNYLGKYPASTTVGHRPVDRAAHALFSAGIRGIPPETR